MATASPWTMTVPQPGQGDYTPCPAGNYPGRVIGLYDVGHQPEVRQNKKTGLDENVAVRKLVVVYELTKKQANGSPYYMAQKFTWSMSDSSNFFKFVVAVTGQKYAPGASFDPTTLLGMACMVNVTNTTPDASGKFYANVDGAKQYPEGFPDPQTTTEPRAWSVMEGTLPPADAWLPRVYGKTIAELATDSTEAKQALQPPAPTGNGNGQPPAQGAYTNECRQLMAKYGLQVGYNADDLAEVSGHLPDGLPPGDRDVLETFSIPF